MQRISPRRGVLVATAVALLALMALAAPAQSAFPGQNGRIAYDDIGNVYSVNPDGSGYMQLTADPDWGWNPEWSPTASGSSSRAIAAAWAPRST